MNHLETLKLLIEGLHTEVVEKVSTYNGVDQHIQFGWVDECVIFLLRVTEESQDWELHEILSDLGYLMSETNMGAQGKGMTVLPELKRKLEKYLAKTAT